MSSKLEAALELAKLGFWVFPVEPNGKKPALKGWQDLASCENDEILSDWFKESNFNIGVSTSKFRDDEALVVVDVDTKKGKDGNASLLALELQGLELPETLTAATPSGGKHLFFSVPRALRQGANVLGEGCDIRSRGGYVLGVGSTIGGRAYQWSVRAPIALCPAWLQQRLGTPRNSRVHGRAPAPRIELDGARSLDRAVHYLVSDAPVAVEGAGGDETTYRVACRVKDFGVSSAKAVDLLLEHWNERCSPPWAVDDLAAKVAHAYAYGVDPPGVADPAADFEAVQDAAETSTETTQKPQDVNPYEKLNREFAFVLAGGGSHILWETRDAYGRQQIIHLDESAFHKKFAAHKVTIGKKAVPLTHDWMEWKGRRSYDGLVFMPGKPRDVTVKDGE